MFYVGDRVKINSFRLARTYKLSRKIAENLCGEVVSLLTNENHPFEVKLDRPLYEYDNLRYAFSADELELLETTNNA